MVKLEKKKIEKPKPHDFSVPEAARINAHTHTQKTSHLDAVSPGTRERVRRRKGEADVTKPPST